VSPALPVLGRRGTVPCPDQRRAGRSRLLRRSEAGPSSASPRRSSKSRPRTCVAVTWVAIKEVSSGDWGKYWLQGFRLARQMSVSTSRLPSRPSLGRSLTRPAKRIAASVKAETAAAGGPRAGIPQGRPPGLFSQGKLRRLPPAVRTRAGAWPRQLADDGAFSRPGMRPSEAARFWPDAATYQAAVSAIEPPPPEESQGGRGKPPT
jgi:hypothetical protein